MLHIEFIIYIAFVEKLKVSISHHFYSSNTHLEDMLNYYIVLSIKNTDFWHQYANFKSDYFLATILTQILIISQKIS